MKHKGILASLAVMLLWGLLFPSVKLGYRVFGIESVGDILIFAGLRFILCGAVICIYVRLRNKEAFRPIRKHWGLVLLAGVFAIILHYAFTYIGLKLTDGSKTAILKQLGAVFYICFSALFFPNDRLTLQKGIGLLLGICGIFAINMNANGFHFHWGDLLILAASFCTVFSNVISKKTFRFVEPVVTTGVSQLFGGVVLTAVGIAFGGSVTAVIPKMPQHFAVLALIVTASVLSYCLWFLMVQKENLSKLFIIKFAEPVFAAIFGWILLGENIFNVNYLVAFVLISAGILVANVKHQPK